MYFCSVFVKIWFC